MTLRLRRTSKLPFLRGEHLILRPLERQDIYGSYLEWFNDAVVCSENGHHLFPYTAKEALAYIERSHGARDQLVLAIALKKSGRHIGNITLKEIHPVYRTAEFAIVIGDKECWGKGYSREATRLLLDHAFFYLNLNRVYCGTFESNIPMRRLASFLGMREEGRRRQAVFKHNRFLNVIEYGILRREYVQRFGTPKIGLR